MSLHTSHPAVASHLVNMDETCSDTVDSFALIAEALENPVAHTSGIRIAPLDVLAIIAGWMILAALIYFPALQLAGLAICAAYIAIKSMKATATPQLRPIKLHI